MDTINFDIDLNIKGMNTFIIRSENNNDKFEYIILNYVNEIISIIIDSTNILHIKQYTDLEYEVKFILLFADLQHDSFFVKAKSNWFLSLTDKPKLNFSKFFLKKFYAFVKKIDKLDIYFAFNHNFIFETKEQKELLKKMIKFFMSNKHSNNSTKNDKENIYIFNVKKLKNKGA